MRVIVFVTFAVVITLASAVPKPKADPAQWWKSAIFYQVYPRSFKDNDNDGAGDLKGIIDKIDHFINAGITAVWLSPIYQSPQVDSGYDISNFREIDPMYGTMEDLQQLLDLAHEKGLKVVMDFVPNHSSDQHQWFIDSENGVAAYKDFYVWKDGTGPEKSQPPNNWLSIWRGSAWEWSNKRQQFYLHQFSKQQPDLNYANPALVDEMTGTLKYWLDKGVDGFRIDAIPYMFETGMEDEPLSHLPGLEEDEYDYLNHTLTKDQDGTYQQIYKWRKFVDEYYLNNGGGVRVLMTEAYTTLENTMRYYGDDDNLGAHFSFNFQLINAVDMEHKGTGIAAAINAWMDAMRAGDVANWVIGNHDNHRVATRYSKANADGMNMVIMMLPGIAVTYNGEEIGMEDGEVAWEQCQDPSVCPQGGSSPRTEEDFWAVGRDFERTPFHWDTSNTNAGFNEGHETWLPVSEKYMQNNLAQQVDDKKSHFNIYTELTRTVRPALQLNLYSDYLVDAYNDDVLIVRRTTFNAAAASSTILLFNLGDAAHIVNLYDFFGDDHTIGEDCDVILSSGSIEVGSILNSTEITLAAHDSIIFTVENGA